MKRLITILLAMALTLTLAACGGNNGGGSSNDDERRVGEGEWITTPATTTPPTADNPEPAPPETTTPPTTTTPEPEPEPPPMDISGAMTRLSYSDYEGVLLVDGEFIHSFSIPGIPDGSYVIPSVGVVGSAKTNTEEENYQESTIKAISERLPDRNLTSANIIYPVDGKFTVRLGAKNNFIGGYCGCADTSTHDCVARYLAFVVGPNNVVLGHIYTVGNVPDYQNS